MIDVQKHVAYWKDGAAEDLEVAVDLIAQNRIRHGLFFAHLALEKMLKAHICLHTSDLAPRIHNLIRLAEVAELSLTVDQQNILADMNAFNIEGRYPNTLTPVPSLKEAKVYLERTKEVYEWLLSQL
jgi:HEPN domain-containing protein